MTKRAVPVALVLVALAVASGVSASRTDAPTRTVTMPGKVYDPPHLDVLVGTTVTWKNEDDSPHRIGDNNGTFKSAALDTDDTFSHTFAAPGEYPYICTIHPYMAGKIIVKPAGKMSSN